MKNQKSKIKDHTLVRGFTIIECLLGLAISAVLLTAVAVAFNASAMNYRENEDLFRTINSARQALTRMTSEIRTAGYLDESTAPATWYGVAHNATPSNRCTLFLPNHDLIRYEFDSADKKLYLRKNNNDPNYVLCDNVTNATFTTTSANGVDATSVQVSLTVQSGQAQRTLAAAAVIRRNL